jgi:hypothetical protein
LTRYALNVYPGADDAAILKDLTPAHRALLLALVEADPPENRGESLYIEMQARSMAFNRGHAVSVPVNLHELRHLFSLGLIDLRDAGGLNWGVTPRPFADRVAQLILESEGTPPPELAAVRRGEVLDRRYATFGRRIANLLVLVPFVVWGAISAIIPAASAIPGFPVALIVAAAAWSALLGWFGKTAMGGAHSVRDWVATRLARSATWVVEGT